MFINIPNQFHDHGVGLSFTDWWFGEAKVLSARNGLVVQILS